MYYRVMSPRSCTISLEISVASGKCMGNTSDSVTVKHM